MLMAIIGWLTLVVLVVAAVVLYRSTMNKYFKDEEEENDAYDYLVCEHDDN